MSGIDMREAVVLTIAGVGAVFVILVLIQVLTLLMKRFIPAGQVPSLGTGEKATQENASSGRREKELAAVAAVAATLAMEEERRSTPVMTPEGAGPPGSEWRRSGREQAMRSRGRRGWRS